MEYKIITTEKRHCERSEAIQYKRIDCFVATLLAMTSALIGDG
jgi:hypothetical protein